MGRNRGTGFVIFPAMRLFQTDGGWGWGGKRGVLEFPTPSQTKPGQSSDATKLQFTSLAGRVSRSGTALVRFRPVTQKEGGWVGGWVVQEHPVLYFHCTRHIERFKKVPCFGCWAGPGLVSLAVCPLGHHHL